MLGEPNNFEPMGYPESSLGSTPGQEFVTAGSYTGIDFLSLLIRKMLHGDRFQYFSFHHTKMDFYKISFQV